MGWTLSSLPSEILGHILSDSATNFVVVRLWKCGNRLLCSKLSSGVRRVRLTAQFPIYNKFPLFFGELRILTHLTLKYHRSVMKHSPDWMTFMHSLPSSLESLSIRSMDVDEALLNFAPEWTAENRLCIETEYARGSSNLIDMETLFPRLHTLKLEPCAEVETDPSIDSSDFAGLPSTLTCLHANFYLNYKADSGVMHLLPRSLRELRGGPIRGFGKSFFERLVADWANAPPQLEIFTGFYPRKDIHHLTWLPRSITEYDGLRPDWTLTSALSCPPLLQQHSIAGVDLQSFRSAGTNWIQALPSRLTDLSVWFDPKAVLHLQDLPTTLIKLRLNAHGVVWHHIGGLSDDAAQSSKSWPPRLESLDIFEMPHTHFNHLPTTLTNLKVSFCKHVASGIWKPELEVDASLFPPHITSLSCQIPYGAEEGRALSLYGPLPAKLRTLKLMATERRRAPVTRSSFASFPQTLTSLHYGSLAGASEDSASADFPLDLKTLETEEFNCEWFGTLPRSLTAFKTSHFNVSDTLKADGRIFEGLPASLERLEVTGKDLTSNVLPSQRLASVAPLRLRELCLYNCGKFPSSFMRELPPTLEIVSVDFQELLEEDALFFPPKLANMNLGPMNWNNPNILKHKPWKVLRGNEIAEELKRELSQ